MSESLLTTPDVPPVTMPCASVRKLRVAHLVFSLEPGGLENGVVNLCNRLDPLRFEPSICVFKEGGSLEQRLSPHVQLLATPRRWRYDPTLPFRLARVFRQQQFDIVHTHSWGTLVEGVIGARMAGVPTVLHGEHGVLETRPRNCWVQRKLWSKTEGVLSVAAPLADEAAQTVRFPREKITVIVNGVDTDRFAPAASGQSHHSPFRQSPDELVIGTVARLVSVKHHEGTLAAIAQLRSRGVACRLILAGDGERRAALEQLALQLGIAEYVHFMGNVTDVPSLLRQLDLFVLNSNLEGMSNTILEAMASELPVVATRVGNNPELIVPNETGLLIAPQSEDGLVDALTRLAASPELRQQWGSAGRQRVLEHFSIHQMIRNYEQFYLRTAAARRIGLAAAELAS